MGYLKLDSSDIKNIQTCQCASLCKVNCVEKWTEQIAAHALLLLQMRLTEIIYSDDKNCYYSVFL